MPSGGAGQPAAPVKLDVIFVATDLEIVNAMLTLANVTRDDVVYDLGCGDGRIVIAAAKEFGAPGGRRGPRPPAHPRKRRPTPSGPASPTA